MKLSDHFTKEEFEHSSTAIRLSIKNEMNSAQIASARLLCVNVLEVIRKHYNSPVILSSGFRSYLLNQKVGGSGTSSHCKAEAADIHVLGKTTEEVFQDIIQGEIKGLVYDQCLQEFNSWIHISFRQTNNRMQKLRVTSSKGKVVYTAV